MPGYYSVTFDAVSRDSGKELQMTSIDPSAGPPVDDAGRDFAAYVRDLVEAAMLSRGFGRPELVKAAGISEPTLRRRLNGSSPFDVHEIGQIAGALGMSVSELLSTDGFRVMAVVEVEGDDNQVTVAGGDVAPARTRRGRGKKRG